MRWCPPISSAENTAPTEWRWCLFPLARRWITPTSKKYKKASFPLLSQHLILSSIQLFNLHFQYRSHTFSTISNMVSTRNSTRKKLTRPKIPKSKSTANTAVRDMDDPHLGDVTSLILDRPLKNSRAAIASNTVAQSSLEPLEFSMLNSEDKKTLDVRRRKLSIRPKRQSKIHVTARNLSRLSSPRYVALGSSMQLINAFL
jgi:hypothetical protein